MIQPMGMPMNQPMGMPMNQPMGIPMNQPMGVPMNQPMGMPFNQPMGMPMNQPVGMGINQSMGMSINQSMGMNNQNEVISRLKQEYDLCVNDNDLIQIGCNFGLENNNIFIWRITMVGPRNTPYDRGLFTIIATFPPDYPNHGPEFKFRNRIYHLNVDFKKDLGHICINSINDWRIRGRVKDLPFYTMKQALFDIFCLFYNQGVEGAYDEQMADQYLNHRDQFDAEAKNWTQLYAKM